MTDFKFMTGLRPELVTLAIQHRQACEAIGLPLVFLSGLRSAEEQMALYAKGRTVNEAGIWVVTDPHLIVTNALPDHTPHTIGAAYDAAPAPGGRIDWNRIYLFERMGRLAPVGLTWGGSWPRFKDLCHFELDHWRTLPRPGGN